MLGSSSFEYFIGISLPIQESRFVLQLKQYLSAGRHLNLTPAHITLWPPFLSNNQVLLIAGLTKWSQKQKSFKSVFEKIAVFKQTKYVTLVLEPNKSEPFKLLKISLGQTFPRLPDFSNFRPHLTLINHIDYQKLDQVKSQVRALQIKLKLKVKALTLYRRQPPGRWQEYQSFPFKI